MVRLCIKAYWPGCPRSVFTGIARLIRMERLTSTNHLSEFTPPLSDPDSRQLLKQEAARSGLTEGEVARLALNLLVHFREQMTDGAEALLLCPASEAAENADLQSVPLVKGTRVHSPESPVELVTYELSALRPRARRRTSHLRLVD